MSGYNQQLLRLLVCAVRGDVRTHVHTYAHMYACMNECACMCASTHVHFSFSQTPPLCACVRACECTSTAWMILAFNLGERGAQIVIVKTLGSAISAS